MFFLLFTATLYHAWFPSEAEVENRNERLGLEVNAPLSLEEHMLEFQVKILVGTKLETVQPSETDFFSQLFSKELKDRMNLSLQDSARSLLDADTSADSARTLTKKLILALYFEEYERAEILAKAVEKFGDPINITPLVLEFLIQKQNGQKIALNHQSYLQVEKNILGLFEKILDVIVFPKDEAKMVLLRNATEGGIKKMISFSSYFIVFVALGIVSFFALSFRIRKDFKQRSHESEISSLSFPWFSLLETFNLYLLGMFLLPYFFSLIQSFGWKLPPLIGSGGFILALLLLLLWPLTWGVRPREIFSALGLKLFPLSTRIKDLFISPFCYLGMWVPLSVVLVLYAQVLSKIKINSSDGAHPVVSVLAENPDPSIIWKIVILAVVIAPIVEECMFRGALYGWLRSIFGSWISMLLSGFIFAAVHPQGVLGLVPLTAIGFFLALIREWRGTLYTSMFVHACVNGGTLYLVTSIFRDM